MNSVSTAIHTVYLRCDEPVAKIDWQAVEKGIKEACKYGAVNLTAKGVRLEMFREAQKAVDLALKIGLSVRVDLIIEKSWEQGFNKLLKCGVEVVAVLTPQTLAQGALIIPRSIAPHITTYVVVDKTNQQRLEADVERLLVVYSVKRVVVHLTSRVKPEEYVDLCARICKLAVKYPGKVWARIPWALLDDRSWSVVRRLCNYSQIIGLCLDGGVIPCGLKRGTVSSTPSIRDASLQDILRSDPIIVGFRETRVPESVQGICRRCVFRWYCANICPAYVYNVSGSFISSYPDCEALAAHGLFPKQCLLS